MAVSVGGGFGAAYAQHGGHGSRPQVASSGIELPRDRYYRDGAGAGAVDGKVQPLSSPRIPRPGVSPLHLVIAGITSIGLAAVGLVALVSNGNELGVTIVISLGAYGLLLAGLVRSSPRLLSVANLFAGFWMVWFPVRLLVMQVDRDSVALHPTARAASDGEFVVVWLLSLAGFAAFALGVFLVRRRGPRKSPDRFVPNVARSTYLLIAVVGLVMTWAQVLTGFQSGILTEVGAVFLFGIAGAAFLESRDRHWSWALPMLVGAAALLGTVTWFKAAAIAPVLAWAIGSALGGLRITWPRALVAVVIALAGFASVQGERLTGGSANPVAAARSALFEYDLTTGLPEQQPDAGAAATNLFFGVLNRTAGADALLVVRARTPAAIPFQGGNTLWEPAASVLPGARRLLGDDLHELSLGRYFSVNFWSVNPRLDPSAQAITMPGDFYLNFGAFGLVVGMVGIGLLLGFFERLFPAGTPFGAAALAYAGLPLVTVESNVAYAIVTSGIRLGVVFALLVLLDVASRRRSSPHVEAAAGVVRVRRSN